MIKKTMSLIHLISQTLFALLTIIVGWEVASRYIFNNPNVWTTELTLFIFPWCIFLGLIIVTKNDGHLKVDSFLKMMPTQIQKMAGWLNHIIIITFTVYLGLGGIALMTLANQAQRKSPVLGIPMEIFYLSIVVGAVMTVFVYIYNIVLRLSKKSGIESEKGVY